MFWPTLILILDILLLLAWAKRRRRKGEKLAWYWWIIGPTNVVALSILTLGMLIGTGFFLYETFPVSQKRTEAEIEEIALATTRYIEDTERFPSSIDEVIGKNPLRRDWKTDYWGSAYTFVQKDGTFKVISSGSDESLGTDDDIVVEVRSTVQ